jgi:hypothetical protein
MHIGGLGITRKVDIMCNCVEMSNEALKPRGLQLSQAFVFGKNKISAMLYIDTEKIDKQDRKVKTAKIMVTYCPFCGEKIDQEATQA